jgi:hypothetical protein
MIITAIVAVAVGVMPVNVETKAPQTVNFDQTKIAQQVGPYKKRVHKDGSTEVYGFDRLGRAYDLTITANGHVTGEVGSWDISFDVRDAA